MEQNITYITVNLANQNNFEYVSAVQGDSNRFVYITVLNGQVPYDFSGSTAVLRGTKPDNNSIFNNCSISGNNEVIVELDEQVLAVPGLNNYEIAFYANDENNHSICITSFPFNVYVSKALLNTSAVISSDEFKAIANVMSNVNTLYELVDEANNAKIEAKESEINASFSESKAKKSEDNASESEKNALNYYNLSKSYSVGTENEIRENDSTDNAKYYKEQSATSATNANTFASQAEISESNTKTYMKSALTYSNNAESLSNLSKSYAIGGTGTRENEDTDNAKYYKEQVETLVSSVAGALKPMGTITFTNIPTNPSSGDMYNISDSFTTDERFKDGIGLEYPSGTNIYYTYDGFWDCLAGDLSNIYRYIESLNQQISNINNTKIDKVNILETLEDVSATTESGKIVDALVVKKLNSNLGILLWENPKRFSSFAEQTIVLSSTDYDYLMIFYRSSAASTSRQLYTCLTKQDSSHMSYQATPGGTYMMISMRSLTDNGDGTVEITSGSRCNIKTGSVTVVADDNTVCIPDKIYGCKFSV